MAIDPRNFTKPFKCAASVAAETAAQNNSRNALGALDKLSQIESNNKVSTGLRTLVKISDAGGPKVTNLLNNGINGVYSAVGLDSNLLNGKLNNINPQAVNNGKAAAESILFRAKNKDFKVEDIPNYLQDFNNLHSLSQIMIASEKSDTREAISCVPSPYAMDLVTYGIKHKFMFVVEFHFNEPFGVGHGGTGEKNIVATLVKSTGRPNVTYEYEDINMYNFKTKVIKSSTFAPIDMMLIDDDQNYSMEFLMNYLELLNGF